MLSSFRSSFRPSCVTCSVSHSSSCARRYIFSLPNLSSLSPFSNQGPQTYTERRVLSGVSRKQVYDVVADVAKYDKFVPFCVGSRILTQSERLGRIEMEAELVVGFLSFKESYVSKVTCVPHCSVQAIASSTPLFKTLVTKWQFASLPESGQPIPNPDGGGAPVSVFLDLTYEFNDSLHNAASHAFFGKVSERMIDAFQQRIGQVTSLRIDSKPLH